MNTEQLDRKKRYYQKNRSKILKARREKRQSGNVSPRLSFGSILSSMSGNFRSCVQSLAHFLSTRALELILLSFLITCCTCFLISESAKTLTAISESNGLAKAALCELVLLGASMLTVTRRGMQILRFLVLGGIFSLSLLSTLGLPLIGFTNDKQRVESTSMEVSLLQRNLDQKQAVLTKLVTLNRISAARHMETELSQLTDRLTRSKHELASQKSEPILQLGFVMAALFRVVIMLANMIFANRLGQLLRINSVVSRPTTVAPRAKLYLVSN